jgi:hypothetical protein
MPTRYKILIRKSQFVPDVLHTSVGDEVIWENHDADTHAATSDPGAICFDTGDIPAGATSPAVALNRISGPSGFGYRCAHHSGMTGRIFFVAPANFVFAGPPGPLTQPPGPTYDVATWQVIAKHVAVHWIEDMANNFLFAMQTHLDADLDKIKTAWSEIEAWWQTKTGVTAHQVGAPRDHQLG